MGIEKKYIGEMKIFVNNPNVKLMEEYKKHVCQRFVNPKSIQYQELKTSLKNHSLESPVYSKISMGIQIGKFYIYSNYKIKNFLLMKRKIFLIC